MCLNKVTRFFNFFNNLFISTNFFQGKSMLLKSLTNHNEHVVE